jgi:hypothetical protein
LDIDGGSVVTTEDHPYWNATDRAWEQIQDFDPGDLLLTASGRLVAVHGLDYATTHHAPAYNLTVAGIHTYYVVAGHHTVLVHNCGEAANLTPGNSAAAARGTAVHNGGEWTEHIDSVGYSRGSALPSGRVPDAFTQEGFPVELKPATSSGIRAGTRQLRGYMGEMGVDYGELWTYSHGVDGVTFSLAAIPKSPFRWLKW